MNNFICKKCGSTEYEIKDKANGTGIAHGLYCAKCGFWHKWLGKEELKQYKQKERKETNENKAEKSLRWVVNQIPDFEPKNNEEKMLVAIKLYSEAGAEEIKRLESENAALRARIDKFDDLHIHMGEAIYIITDNNEIIERFICGIHILSTEIIFVTAITANYKPCDKKGVAAQGWHCIKNNLGLIPLRYFGERAFTDRAAAEKRLAELKGETK